MKSVLDDDTPHLGFQIAPMIDVVFVIMLFFMVMAGAVKVENHLISTLPGSIESDSVDFVDETIVTEIVAKLVTSENLTEVYDAFDGRISYTQLKFVNAHYQAKRG